MTKLWVDPPEGWKYGFPAIYDSETDGQMSEWIVNKGYPVQTIKEYGEQWHIRCWSTEEPEKYPDQVINAQEQPKAVENAPIGASREQLMAEVAVLTELVRVLSDRVAELEKPWRGLTEDEVFELSNTMPYADRFEFAQAIEAKLKEKNT